jgi:hypothetical protein
MCKADLLKANAEIEQDALEVARLSEKLSNTVAEFETKSQDFLDLERKLVDTRGCVA